MNTCHRVVSNYGQKYVICATNFHTTKLHRGGNRGSELLWIYNLTTFLGLPQDFMCIDIIDVGN